MGVLNKRVLPLAGAAGATRLAKKGHCHGLRGCGSSLSFSLAECSAVLCPARGDLYTRLGCSFSLWILSHLITAYASSPPQTGPPSIYGAAWTASGRGPHSARTQVHPLRQHDVSASATCRQQQGQRACSRDSGLHGDAPWAFSPAARPLTASPRLASPRLPWSPRKCTSSQVTCNEGHFGRWDVHSQPRARGVLKPGCTIPRNSTPRAIHLSIEVALVAVDVCPLPRRADPAAVVVGVPCSQMRYRPTPIQARRYRSRSNVRAPSCVIHTRAKSFVSTPPKYFVAYTPSALFASTNCPNPIRCLPHA